MTSEFEGLPLAMLEAMSMGCAIVSTDAGGIKEVIRNGIDGFTEKKNDWEKLAEPLSYLIQHPAKIEEYGKKARIRVEQNFSLNKMVREIENQYQSVLKS